MTTRTERMERFLKDQDGDPFTSHDYADAVGISHDEASGDIQSYLAAQRSVRQSTEKVLYRKGRTRAARWQAGERAANVREVGDTFYEDTQTKLTRAMLRDMNAQADLNPRVRQKVATIAESVTQHAMAMLRLAVRGIDDTDR